MRTLLSQFNVYRWAGKMIVDAAHLRSQERVAQRRPVPELEMWEQGRR
jgi:trehalose 6-phosphate synthase